jgi:hypothetical protein
MKIAESMKDTTRDIMASYNQRVKAVGGIVDDTRSTLNRFGRDRRKMGADQSKALAEFTGDLAQSIGGLLGGIRDDMKAMSRERVAMAKDLNARLAKEAHDIKSHTEKKLKEFSNAHGEMSDALKKELVKSVRDTTASVKTILGNASALIGEYRADIKKAGTAWSSMAASLAHARKKGRVTSIEMGGDTSSVEEAVEKKSKKKKENEGAE